MKPIWSKACLALLASAAIGLTTSAQAADDCPLPGNLRVVIGSTSTGGDTYQNSSIVVDQLAKKLDINAKVDAVGVMPAFQALERSRHGNTIMIFHDGAYLGHLYGVNGYPDIFTKYLIGPTIAINPGNAYLVPKDSPYQTLDDIMAAAGNGKQIRVAIQPGGVSEIGFSALKNAVRMKYPGKEGNIVAVNTGSQADKNQLLFDGAADVINGSVQANEQYTQLPADDQKAMRFVWITARHDTVAQTEAAGMGDTTREQLLQYVTPNVEVPMGEGQDFTFDKEFFFLYNKDMDPAAVKCIDDALADIYDQGEIQKQQKRSFFIPDFKPSAQAATYLEKKNEEYRTIIDDLKG
ncbi:ABC transporter substrate-binding protein [Salinicola endophyticus]|uniref:ABC transporter substrate-binding protein n=1 Tax=Salinicola endophyticus TaxID=1949083 RepID=A0ABY8FL80_9GAMM|nr:ABC transporter substrate-binding protein [Salinicola endophyticus]WFF40629.1 ABC transporter substrate-binding protein [Salinicola endophyticus]